MGFLKGDRRFRFDSIFEWWAGLFEDKDKEEAVSEWHAFVQGWFGVICLFPPRYKPNEELQTEIEGEHHYYMFGRMLGVLTWILIIKVVIF